MSSVIPHATSSKTLYTPVFYATPLSSLLDAEKPFPKLYLERMSKKHIALATKVQEVPPSRSASPDSDEHSAARVDALRKRAEEAFKQANGDPADGKWAALSQILKLNVARNRRWLHTTTEGKMAESSFGWINAETEEEWEEWDTKWLAADRVKRKVEDWNRDVEGAPIVSISQQVERAPTAQNILAKEKRTNSFLGFPVVKRSSLNVIGKKTKGLAKASASNAAAGPSSLSSRPIPRAPEPPLGSSVSKPLRPIQDLSESSFLPPSFPSQLDTSTPNKIFEKRHKPEPIVLAPPSSSPLPTPPSVRVYGRQRTMSTLSELPSTPTRTPPPPTTAQAQHGKRARSVTPPQSVKKACIREGSPLVVPPVITPITPVVTPQRAQLPRLTDLIASSKKAKAASPRRRLKGADASAEVTPAPPVPESKSKVQQEVVPPEESEQESEQLGFTPVLDQPREEELEPDPADEAQEDLLPPVIDEDLTPGLYEYTTRLTHDEDEDDRDRSSAYNLIASPARSLSSLAASDSDSEKEENDGPGFAPPFTSTQNQMNGKEKTLGWMGYNSQFDVDGKVDMLSKFMEKDVDVDFAGWLEDPSVELEPAGESQ
ncbi:hypothetical protein DXG01_006939 [Tephrocybe rancida]|nr:hypothetical protein DXG01_006939 [Tephrocybe rancida]